MPQRGERCQARTGEGRGGGGDGRARGLEGSDTRRTRTHDTVRWGREGRLCGDDPLQMKGQRVPRRGAVGLRGREPEVAENLLDGRGLINDPQYRAHEIIRQWI